jgi:hypothetical protein
MVQKNLGFVDQPPERRAMHNAVAVTLVLGARGRGGLWVASAARLGRITGVDSQHHELMTKQPLAGVLIGFI